MTATNDTGRYRLTVTDFNGKRETITTDCPFEYDLIRMIDKCEIKKFTISLT